MKIIDLRYKKVKFKEIKTGEWFTCARDKVLIYTKIDNATIFYGAGRYEDVNAICLNDNQPVYFDINEHVHPVDVEIRIKMKSEDR